MMFWTCFALVLLAVASDAGYPPKPEPEPKLGELSELDTLYLPSPESGKPELDSGAVESLAYDPKAKVIYVVGDEVLHVVDASDPEHLKRLFSQSVPGFFLSDVEVCGDVVFVTAQNLDNPKEGKLKLFERYSGYYSNYLELILSTTVGPFPKEVQPRKDCQSAVVAVEATPFTTDSGKFVDPEGAVAIVKIRQGSYYKVDADVTTLLFREFNGRFKKLEDSGVRYVYRNSSFSRDIEPVYITIDEENNRAFVSLQVNNAIAVVDLETEKIISIDGLGSFLWGYFDASDKDDGIRISYWRTRSFYQPQGIKYIKWQGRDLIFSANEGATKRYEEVGFDETRRGNTFRPSELTKHIPKYVREALGDDSKLGRLVLSRFDGLNGYGEYEQLFHFGTRSLSIWDANTFEQLYDSDFLFEEMTALECPHLFNSEGNEIDTTSDDMGSEPENLALLELGGRLYVYVASEKPGTILVFSVGDDVSDVRFESIFCAAFPDNGKNLKENFNHRSLIAFDPEELKVVAAEDNPTGFPIVFVPGARAGTVSALRIGDGEKRQALPLVQKPRFRLRPASRRNRPSRPGPKARPSGFRPRPVNKRRRFNSKERRGVFRKSAFHWRHG